MLVPAAALIVIGALAGSSLGGCQTPSSSPGQTSSEPVPPDASPVVTIPVPSQGGRPSPTIEVPPPIR